MNKVKIRITLFALITGMFLVVVSGCGYRCQGWAYRTAYRQVCKSYSSNGHCSFWGSESYQERYCTRWIKDPDPKRLTYSEPRPVPKTPETYKKKPVPQASSLVTKYFITKAGKSHFPQNVKKQTLGETYLLSELTPFLCEIAKSGIRKTVNSMGGTYKNKKSKSGGKKYKYVQFSTNKFTGSFFPKESYSSNSCSIYQANYKPWPFSKDELVDWLSSMGFDVFRNGNYIIGGKGFIDGGSNRRDQFDYINYTSSIQTHMSKYGSGISIDVRWKMKSEAMAALCKERYQKLKNLPQKEQKQRRETIKNQVKITTHGLTASELNNKALALWKDGKYTDPDRAIAYLSKAIRLDSKYANAYINRGLAWHSKGNYDREIVDYNKTIQLNPRNALAYNNRGFAWYSKGNYDRAIVDYNKTIQLNPRNALAYFNRGLAWHSKGNYDRAIADYNKAIQLNPNYVDAYGNRGVAWLKKDNFDQANKDFRKSIELSPQNANAFYNLACLNAMLKRPKDACEWLRKAIDLKETYREYGRNDRDFDKVRENDCFIKLTN